VGRQSVGARAAHSRQGMAQAGPAGGGPPFPRANAAGRVSVTRPAGRAPVRTPRPPPQKNVLSNLNLPKDLRWAEKANYVIQAERPSKVQTKTRSDLKKAATKLSDRHNKFLLTADQRANGTTVAEVWARERTLANGNDPQSFTGAPIYDAAKKEYTARLKEQKKVQKKAFKVTFGKPEIKNWGQVLNPAERTAYKAAFGGWRVKKFNLFVVNITGRDLYEAYGARRMGGVNAGDLKIANGGQPFIFFEYFATELARMAAATIAAFGFPPGSFFQLQMFDQNGGLMTVPEMTFARPSAQIIEGILTSMTDNTVSGNRLGTQMGSEARLQFTIYNPGTGRAGKIPKHLAHKCKSIWNPPGKYCAAKSLAVLMAEGNARKSLKARSTALDKAIIPLLKTVGHHESWTFSDLDKAAEHLGVVITVISVWTYDQVFCTHSKEALSDYEDDAHLFLLHDPLQGEGHYMACLNPDSLEVHKIWCHECQKLYRQLPGQIHVCAAHACKLCGAKHDSKQAFREHFYGTPDHRLVHVECPKCFKLMPDTCLQKHAAVCQSIHVRCRKCGETYINADASTNPRAITREQHDGMCGQGMKYCDTCGEHKAKDHSCWITRHDFSYCYDKPGRRQYVFDIEAAKGDLGKQDVTYVSVREVIHPEEGETASAFLARSLEFHAVNKAMGFTSLRLFCEWAAGLKNCLLVAHNMSGYDGVIVHNFLRYEMQIKTYVINAGLKVMCCKWGSNKMIDSLKHMTTSLAKMPKLLGLDLPGLQKDYFPHDFNTVDNRGYEGALPDAEYYDIDKTSINPKDFAEWHAEEQLKYVPHTDKPWNLAAVEKTYCDQDTYVLAVCWGVYRQLFIELCNIDPANSVTIASYCMKVYRQHDIPEEGIETLPMHYDVFQSALKGGRTEAFAVKYEGPSRFLDVTSMYPAVMASEVYPYGKPTIYESDNIPDNWNERCVCGFITWDFSPPPYDPKDPSFKPVIGAKNKSGKLTFDHERKQCTTTLAEARMAVKMGYTVHSIQRIYHFEEARSDLFKSYIYRFLKLKVEASSPPADPDVLVQDYKRLYGIELDRAKLEEPENAGLRALAKLCLNSLWGKFGEREKAVAELCDAPRFHRLMADNDAGKVSVRNVEVDPHLDSTVAVTYDVKELGKQIKSRTHNAIAAHVTAYARLVLQKLFNRLRDLGPDFPILYCDTDSVLMGVPHEGYKFDFENEHLGGWALDTACETIDGFVALAPKFYAVRGKLPDGLIYEKVRAKGFNGSNLCKKAITFETMLQAVKPDEDGMYPTIGVEYNHFRRQKYGGMFVGKMTKQARFQPPTLKGVYRPESSEFLVPFGPHIKPLTPTRGVKRKGPASAPLPPVRYAKNRRKYVPPKDVDSEAELSDQEAEDLMQLEIARQDAQRSTHITDLIEGQ